MLAVKLEFTPGQVVSNKEIMAVFKCACEGGIRPANATNTIVLVVNHVLGASADGWQNGTLDFTGAGSLGDQTLEKGRNKTLAKAFETGRPVYLFEVFQPQKYTFDGRVNLASAPFQKEEPDREGNKRKVWVFPLKLWKGDE